MGMLNRRCGVIKFFFAAVILVLGMVQFTVAQNEVGHLKWSQPPVETDPVLGSPIYCGWDEPSLHTATSAAASPWKVVADDFRCLGSMPITSIRWWGSYNNWSGSTLPANKPIAWRIAFWSNTPADSSINFSRPGRLLWQVEVSADRVYQARAGIDSFPDKPSDTCFQYYVQLSSDEYFWQNQFIDAAGADPGQHIFWISISAIYTSSLANPWGWKTRPRHWMDNAVKLELTVSAVQLGLVVDSSTVKTITSSAICSRLEGYDTAFELETDPNYIKWEQQFTGIRSWRHYEDEESMALEDQAGVVQIRRLVADNWKCLGRNPITAIAWWGSYIGYRYQACQCGSTTGAPKQSMPDYFLLSIWTDEPDTNLNNPRDFSHPGQKVWEYKASEYDEVLVGYDKYPETMLAGLPDSIPLASSELSALSVGHEPVFRYSVQLPQENWFCQEVENQIYWLNIIAVYKNTQTINFPWGWTNHEGTPWTSASMNSDAVVGDPIGSSRWVWQELYDQLNLSEDMSFVLFTEPGCFPCCHEDYYEWLSVGKPACWCYPRQCHGDADGKAEGGAATGFYYVGNDDMQILVAAWKVKEPPHGPGISTIPNGICADFAHDKEGSAETGFYRVGQSDLNIMIANWMVKEPPAGTGVPADCNGCAAAVTCRPACTTTCPAVQTTCPAVQTQCPATQTRCPTVETRCPAVETRCPGGATNCPVVQTQCPAVSTQCQAAQTQCPAVSTQCPPVQTQCPAMGTQCPPQETLCPSGATNCPVVQTQCPAVNTMCPGGQTQCPAISTQCPPEQTRCPAMGTQCPPQETLCPSGVTYCPAAQTQCPAVSTQCPAAQTRCPVVNTRCPTEQTRCPAMGTQCPPQETLCPSGVTYCPAAQTQCPAVSTQCPAAQTRCPVVNTRCPTEQTRCPAMGTQCPPQETLCPSGVTYCPAASTSCPPAQTQCPAVGTQCPPFTTKCPPIQTQCPPVLSSCICLPETIFPTCMLFDSRADKWNYLAAASCPAIEVECPAVVP